MKSCDIKFKINEEGYLLVSCDKGCTWENIGMVKGVQGIQGPQGEQGPQGPSGADGVNGTDGNTPYINELTGTWWIGTTDTGVVAEGTNGEVDIEGSADVAVVGTPSVTKRVVGNKTILQFHELKGERGDAPEITAERVDANNSVVFYVDGVPVVTLYDGIRYSAGSHIVITPTDTNHSVIACDLVAGNGININSNNEIELILTVPTVENELIYSDDGEALTTHQLMYTGAYIVDNDTDFALLTQISDIPTDILMEWQQLSTNKTYEDNYGLGTYISSGIGYGWWHTDSANSPKQVIQPNNTTTDTAHYLIPEELSNYVVEALYGTNSGNTTGDTVGFSIFDTSHATRKYVDTDSGRYYRDTRYDKYADGTTSETYPKRPTQCAWVQENGQTAKVIYTTGPASSGNTVPYPTGTVDVYIAASISTYVNRTNTVLSTTTTVTSTGSASGYIPFLHFRVDNSSNVGVLSHSGNGYDHSYGTIYVVAAVFDVSTGYTDLTNQQIIINGNTGITATTDNYHTLGKFLVPVGIDTNSTAGVTPASVTFNSGILTVKFGNTVTYANKSNYTYNGAELVINFKTRTYDFTPYTGAAIGGTILSKKANIPLPASTLTAGGSTIDFWNCFINKTRFGFSTFSYSNMYIELLNMMIDRFIFHVDKSNSNYGVWGLNASKTAYEKKYLPDGVTLDDPQNYFNGSRIGYNDITDKLFYNDGASIYRIASPTKANDGKLTIKGNETTAVEFTANQSTNKTLKVKGSTGVTISGTDGQITVSTESNHTVVSKTGIITGGSEQGSQAYELDVRCDLSGITVKAVDLEDFATTEYSTPRKFKWTKTAGDIGKYIGLFGISSTDACYVLKVLITNTVTNETESHLYGVIEDTPPDSTFLFVTTNSWPIVCKRFSNSMIAYMQIPDDFVGTIEVVPMRYKVMSGGNVYCFEPTGVSDSTPHKLGWSEDGTEVTLDFYTSSLIYGSDISDLRTPSGRYNVDVIGDFGGSIIVGSKIADSVINDYIIHTLSKKVDSLVNSQSLTIGNTTITEAQLQALLATLQ